MSASRLSSANIEFLVGPWLPFELIPLLTLSVVACTMRWGHFSASLGSFRRSKIALYLSTIVGRSRDDFKCSANLQRDCANNY